MADCNLVITPTPVAYNIYGAKASNKFKEMISMYKTMHNLKNRSKDKKGFTLAELLIVVAIIAVLVAIAIPVFTGQLEKAREATDAANIRTAYAVATVAAMEKGADVYAEVKLTQTQDGFSGDMANVEVGGVVLSDITGVAEGESVFVNVNGNTGALTLVTTAGTGQRIDPITGADI